MAAKKSKKVQKKSAPKTPRKPMTRLDQVTVGEINQCADHVFKSISKHGKPELKFPERSLRNARYDKKGGFQMGRGRIERTLTVPRVKTFVQAMKMMAFSREMTADDAFATKREAYYISKNWGEAKFKDQPESDTVMDDIEALFSLEGVSREQLRFRPEDHGGSVAGQLIVVDRDPETAEIIRHDCTAMGSSAYQIPRSVEHLGFESKAKFVLVVETGGMFDRLSHHKYWRTASCILVGTQGVPSRATRRFIRKLSDDAKLPVYCFNDCDPYGISNIYRTLKVGSGNAVHLNQFICGRPARSLGVTPQDILDFELQDATHPLKEVDVKRAKDALKNYTFFQAHK